MATETRIIAVLVDNEPGVLARVIGLFSGRGYNIESLTVTAVNPEENLSRITIVTSGTPQILEQIKAQLGRVVPVHRVMDFSQAGAGIERDICLVKVAATGEQRVESLRIADVSGARVVDAGLDHFVFELSGSGEEIDRFVALMQPLGLCDVSRSGVIAMLRGREGLGHTLS